MPSGLVLLGPVTCGWKWLRDAGTGPAASTAAVEGQA